VLDEFSGETTGDHDDRTLRSRPEAARIVGGWPDVFGDRFRTPAGPAPSTRKQNVWIPKSGKNLWSQQSPLTA